MKTLIIGKGFVGNALAEIMPDAMHISKSDLDYTNASVLSDYFSNDDMINKVINCSGYTGNPNVDACEINKEECYFYNVVVPQRIQSTANYWNIQMIHVGSGCIYDGYEKDFLETDVPNFGAFSNTSSFYSKTKHISETVLMEGKDTAIVRLRIPFDYATSRKNYIDKLLNYDNLIDYKNSKTDLCQLCHFIKHLSNDFIPGIFNAVHSNALYTREVIAIMKEYGLENPNWKLVPYDQIPIVANRSNCVLSNEKSKIYGFDFGTEEEALREALSKYVKFNTKK